MSCTNVTMLLYFSGQRLPTFLPNTYFSSSQDTDIYQFDPKIT